MDPSKTWYDEDRADEAALALLWISATQEEDHPRREFAADILRRLQERRLITGDASGLTFTELGRSRARAAFKRLFGKPAPATIPPSVKTHVVEEIDGD